MKIVVTGAKGQLGSDIVKEIKQAYNVEVFGIDIDDLDITKKIEVDNYMKKINPDVIIHCAAYTAVDRAEDEKEKCYNVNVIGTKNIVNAAKKSHSKLVYISTDYVFSGEKLGEYNTLDKPNPNTYYGKTKYLGEIESLKHKKNFIIRISWVFGKNGNNFIKTMLNLSKTKKKLKIVEDQIGSPTYTYDLSKIISKMIMTEKYGIYHITNEGVCSWLEFAKEIFKLSKIKIQLEGISSDQYFTKAKRPKNSVMSKEKLREYGFSPLPTWQNALKRFLLENEEIV